MALARSCGDCTLCCKVMGVGDKPAQHWCQHCAIGDGCKIYDSRPQECRDFHCGWLRMPQLGEAWRPTQSKMVIAVGPGENRIAIYVDSARRGQWRNAPYYPNIKHWARALCPRAGQVLVYDGGDVIAILPDRDKNLGPQREGRTLTSTVEQGPNGPICDVIDKSAA